MTQKITNKESTINKKNLNKFYLFLTQVLNIWNKITSVIKNRYFKAVIILLLLICSFIVGFIFKYEIIKCQYYFDVTQKELQQQKERAEIERQVKMVMDWAGSDSLEIFEAIMSTSNPVFMAVLGKEESKFKKNAISPVGALGVWQLMPDKIPNGVDWRDPMTNARIADLYVREIRKTLGKHGNNDCLVMGAYNAGPYAIIKNGYKIPVTKNDETINFTSRGRNLFYQLAKNKEQGFFE